MGLGDAIDDFTAKQAAKTAAEKEAAQDNQKLEHPGDPTENLPD